MTHRATVCFCLVFMGSQQISGANTINLNPIYFNHFTDAITGDNSFIATDNMRYWTIDPGADVYQVETYERPTTQSFELRGLSGGGSAYGVAEYWENLDITQGSYGFDNQYMYFAVEMFGLNNSTSDGDDTHQGLVYEYGVRFSRDPDGRGGLLLRADNPWDNHDGSRTTFSTLSNTAFHDSDDDVGGLGNIGATGLAVTNQDNPSEESDGNEDMNGFDDQIIADGYMQEGPNEKEDALYTRIDPNNENVVEFALDYTLLGFDLELPSLLEYLDFQAIQGGPSDPANYMWNDAYNWSEAGSPYEGDDGLSIYATQGLENIYELDTLRGSFDDDPPPSSDPIPEPATMTLLGLGMAGLALRRKFGSA